MTKTTEELDASWVLLKCVRACEDVISFIDPEHERQSWDDTTTVEEIRKDMRSIERKQYFYREHKLLQGIAAYVGLPIEGLRAVIKQMREGKNKSYKGSDFRYVGD